MVGDYTLYGTELVQRHSMTNNWDAAAAKATMKVKLEGSDRDHRILEAFQDYETLAPRRGDWSACTAWGWASTRTQLDCIILKVIDARRCTPLRADEREMIPTDHDVLQAALEFGVLKGSRAKTSR